MWARSSRRDLLVAACALALAACGKSEGPSKPEADPAKVHQLAAKMLREVPTPAAVPECTQADFDGGLHMTWRTLMQIGGGKIPSRPEDQDWINPHALDAAAARTLAEPPTDQKLARQAAAEALAAPHWIVYKVDYVNAPMALEVKDLKQGTVGTRIIRYEKTGLPGCVLVWFFQNDQKISDDAIAVSDKAAIDPAVAQILRDDLVHQFVTTAPRGANVARPAAGTAGTK
jgi:hypothetical protein